MALLIGFALVAARGVAHHRGLQTVRALTPSPDEKPQAAILVTFLGLLALQWRSLAACRGLDQFHEHQMKMPEILFGQKRLAGERSVATLPQRELE